MLLSIYHKLCSILFIAITGITVGRYFAVPGTRGRRSENFNELRASGAIKFSGAHKIQLE